MPPPATSGFSVETSVLLREAKLWQDEALAMEDIGKRADVLRFSEPGLFTIFVPKYHVLVDAVVARCTEGRDRMVEIHDTLTRIASLYERTEDRHSHDIKSSGQLTR